MSSLMDKQLNFNSKTKTNFNGGDLTSDAPALIFNGRKFSLTVS